MISKAMFALGSKRSVIREMFEYGKKRAAEIGAENVYDFSLGNPNVPAPPAVKQAMQELLDTVDPVLLHGYTSAQGDFNVRKTIAEFINQKHGTDIDADNIYMTTGAAAALSICFKALALPEDEFIAFAPFFTEYRVFVEAAGGKLVVVPPDQSNFEIDFVKFEQALNEHTKAVIVNSPNNPSGVVYSEATIIKLCELLEQKAKAYGHPIYLICDEPYRELVYDDIPVPYLTKYYKNTFVCYSYSKSLSLPGERIGYVVVSNQMEDAATVYAAVCGAGRALGYVCAPAFFQHLIAKCVAETADVSVYKKNRDLLYEGLTKLGYRCIKPNGAFYLFVQAMEADANKFCEKAKQYELLLVPGDDFGCPGYVRIAYCVKTEQIVNAMPAFEQLAKAYHE